MRGAVDGVAIRIAAHAVGTNLGANRLPSHRCLPRHWLRRHDGVDRTPPAHNRQASAQVYHVMRKGRGKSLGKPEARHGIRAAEIGAQQFVVRRLCVRRRRQQRGAGKRNAGPTPLARRSGQHCGQKNRSSSHAHATSRRVVCRVMVTVVHSNPWEQDSATAESLTRDRLPARTFARSVAFHHAHPACPFVAPMHRRSSSVGRTDFSFASHTGIATYHLL